MEGLAACIHAEPIWIFVRPSLKSKLGSVGCSNLGVIMYQLAGFIATSSPESVPPTIWVCDGARALRMVVPVACRSCERFVLPYVFKFVFFVVLSIVSNSGFSCQ